jgi:hypothetical protein
MHLDVRLPIGLLFTLFGIILTGYGVAGDAEVYRRHSLGMNINLVWGLVLLAFGVVMLWVALRSRSRKR